MVMVLMVAVRRVEGFVFACETTLEAKVAWADGVVRGRVVEVSAVAAPLRAGGGSAGGVWHRVRIEVSEVVKGRFGREVEVVVKEGRRAVPGWEECRGERLFFLKEGAHVRGWEGVYGTVGYTVLEDYEPVDLEGGWIVPAEGAVSADMTRLGDREAVMGAARRAAREVSVGMAEVPVTDAEQVAMGLDHTMMVLVPLTEQEARVAEGWAYSAEWLVRWRAVVVLQERRAEGGTEALRHLAGIVPVMNGREYDADFVIGEMARTALAEAGEAAPAETWGPRRAVFGAEGVGTWLVAAGLVAGPLLWWRRRRMGVVKAVFAGMLVVLGVVVGRSFWGGDAVWWGYNNVQAWRGVVYVNFHGRAEMRAERAGAYCRGDEFPEADHVWRELNTPPVGWMVEMGPWQPLNAMLFPEWTVVERVRVPLWVVGAGLGSPWMWGWGAAGMGWLRRRRRGWRGFEGGVGWPS